MKKTIALLMVLALMLALSPAMGEGLIKGPPTPPPYTRDEDGVVVNNAGRQPVLPTLSPIMTPKPTYKPVDLDIPVLSGDAFVNASGELYVSVSSDVSYAVAKVNPIIVTANVSGGRLPYTAEFTVKNDGVTVKEVSSKLGSAGAWTFMYQPYKGGRYTLEVAVTDAAGADRSGSVNVAVSEESSEGPAVWRKSVSGVKLTGDWRIDLVAIAQTQIGYQESLTDFIIDEEDVKHGYTRYGDWYGSKYGEWCASFIAFCCEYADIPSADFPRDASVPALMEKLDDAGAGHDYRYMPSTGDIVFFSLEGDYAPEHVGIVENVTASSIYTIEGNSSDQVRRREYALDADEIVGYASIADLMVSAGLITVEDANLALELPDEAIGVGLTMKGAVNMRAEPSSNSRFVKKIDEKGSEVSILLADDTTGEVWYFVQYKDHLGYIRGDLLQVQLVPVVECTCGAVADENGEIIHAETCAITLAEAELSEEILQWIEETNPTDEMIARALRASSLDALFLEGTELIHVRTGKSIATHDPETGALTDNELGIVVGYIDPVTGNLTSAPAEQ